MVSVLYAQQPVSSEVSAHQSASSAAPAVARPAVFRTGANLVPLTVTVTDRTRQFVKGLTLGDFAVFEDGVAQPVEFFEASDTPLDLILLLDTSSSISDKM